MLVTITGGLVRPYGGGEVALPGQGSVTLVPESHGVWEGNLRGRERVSTVIVDGEVVPVDITPGVWRIHVIPDRGVSWPSWLIDVDGSQDPLDLADVAPVIVIDGEKWTRGKSAYEVAVANGFQGTEQEWLASLATGGVDLDDYATTAAVADADAATLLAAHSYTNEQIDALPPAPGPQILSLAGQSLSISGGNSVTLPSNSGGDGDSGYVIVGPGRPDRPDTTGGTITGSEPVGSEYRSTDSGGFGAHVWRLFSTGWTVTVGDTGWRKKKVSELGTNAWYWYRLTAEGGYLMVADSDGGPAIVDLVSSRKVIHTTLPTALVPVRGQFNLDVYSDGSKENVGTINFYFGDGGIGVTQRIAAVTVYSPPVFTFRRPLWPLTPTDMPA